MSVVPPFFDDALFLEAFAAVGNEIVTKDKPDLVLFSFHGLPVRHIQKSDPDGACRLDHHCCSEVTLQNRNCYRAQCFATARGIAERLGLGPERVPRYLPVAPRPRPMDRTTHRCRYR